MPDLRLTDDELDAVIGWADAAGIGFHYGEETPDEIAADEHDPSLTALKKLHKAASTPT